ncbi:protein kinase, partial [Planctomycetota bacterium]
MPLIEIREGDVLVGRARVVRHLGTGGLGRVFQAQDLACNGEPVTVKILDRLLTRDMRQLGRFFAQVQALLRLDHPNLIRLRAFKRTPEGAYVCITDFSSNCTLMRLLAQAGSRLEVCRAGRLVCQILDVLDYAHRSGVVHGNLKPLNVRIEGDWASRNETARVADFGLAKAIDEAGGMTRFGGVGEPYAANEYMAPEQVLGGLADPRSDQYSAAVILYELVTGTRPFPARSAVQHPMPPTPGSAPPLLTIPPELGVPPALVAALRAALHSRPEARHPSTAELARAIEAALPAGIVSNAGGPSQRPAVIAAPTSPPLGKPSITAPPSSPIRPKSPGMDATGTIPFRPGQGKLPPPGAAAKAKPGPHSAPGPGVRSSSLGDAPTEPRGHFFVPPPPGVPPMPVPPPVGGGQARGLPQQAAYPRPGSLSPPSPSPYPGPLAQPPPPLGAMLPPPAPTVSPIPGHRGPLPPPATEVPPSRWRPALGPGHSTPPSTAPIPATKPVPAPWLAASPTPGNDEARGGNPQLPPPGAANQTRVPAAPPPPKRPDAPPPTLFGAPVGKWAPALAPDEPTLPSATPTAELPPSAFPPASEEGVPGADRAASAQGPRSTPSAGAPVPRAPAPATIAFSVEGLVSELEGEPG